MRISAFIILLYFCSNLFSQGDFSGGYVGMNIGGYFANKNTAQMYSGGSNFSLFGVEWAFNNPFYKPDIDNYFQYPYDIVELPQDMTYRPALDFGFVAGYNKDNSAGVFIEANVSQINIQDAFVVQINNPNNTNPGGLYESVLIFGEEQRLNINLGGKFEVFEKNGLQGFIPLYANINAIKLSKNYFVLNNRQYPIVHNIQGFTNERPGGMGFGGGSGFGVRYGFNDKISFELNYKIMYSKITMIKSIGFIEWGIQQAIGVSILWG
jgi:hypothetical protein